MIVFIRLFISAYIKENRLLYEGFIEIDLDYFCQTEVEAIDKECDQVSISYLPILIQIQMIAVTNAFDIGVQIESLSNANKLEEWKFPEDYKDCFIQMLFRPGHYDILYTKEQR